MGLVHPNILPDVLRLRARGLAVFPVDVVTKRPLIEWGGKEATMPTEEEVRSWFGVPGRAVGVAMGPISRMFLLDLDFAKHPEALEFYEGHNFPRTWKEKTASGGIHLYFKWESALDDRQTNTQSKLYKGVDTKGFGGYSKITPSPGYSWIIPPHRAPLAQVPQWLLDMLPFKGREVKDFEPKPDGWIVSDLENVDPSDPVKGRTPTFVRVIGRFKAKGFSEAEIKGVLAPWAARYDFPGLDALVDDQFRRYPPKPVEDTAKLMNHSLKAAMGAKKQIPYLVNEIIHENTINVMAGLGESRKSWLLLDLAVALASGTPWLGKFPCKKSRVMLIDQERPGDEALRRIDALTKGRKLTIDDLEGFLAPKLDLSPPFKIDADASFARFDALVGDFQPQVVLVDSLKAFQAANINNNQDMQRIFERLKGLRSKYGLTVVILHHENKGGYERTREKQAVTAENIAGATTIHEVPEGVFVVVNYDTQSSFFHHVKNSYGTKVAPFMVCVRDLKPDKSEISVEAL